MFVGAKCAALLQHGVDQCGLTMVHVRDDGDVANAQTQSMGCPLLMNRADGNAQPVFELRSSTYNFTMCGAFSGDYIVFT
jgi:hypothetical protein